MLSLFISMMGILLTIVFVVGTHESAHFFMARLLNVKVLKFSIGFGRAIFTWKDKSGTEYVVAPIPLGGYVKMLDEGEGDVPPDQLHRAFNRQPYYKKFLIVIAGPLMNLLCAFILYWILFMVGFTTIKPIIGKVEPNSIAAKANLKSGQEIVAVDGHETMSWTGILLRFTAHIGNKDNITLLTSASGQSSNETVAKNNRKKMVNAIKSKIGNQANDNNQQIDSSAKSIYQTHILDVSNWKMDELKPDPLSSLGFVPYQPDIPLVIGVMVPNSPATESDLKLGDKIIALDKLPVKDWEQLITTIIKQPLKGAVLTIKRDNKTMDVPVTIGLKTSWSGKKSGYLGIGPFITLPDSMLRKVQYSPLQAADRAWSEMVTFTYFNFLLIGKLIAGKMSFHSLGGPITIFDSAGQALNSGWLSFIGFLAFISVALGVLNLLPIPGLDGGHLFIQTIEAIIQRPLPDMILVNLYRCGMLVLLFMLVQAVVNDVLRLY